MLEYSGDDIVKKFILGLIVSAFISAVGLTIVLGGIGDIFSIILNFVMDIIEFILEIIEFIL